ncbi:MAG TPA: hypothetical protein VFV99_06165 [Kofleriaceae bacterium]|nr:hypothetical protein [Kofleriaceae bacterium]
MAQLWSPLKAAIVVFLVVVVIGAVVGVVITSANGTIHDHSFDRGQAMGQGIGTIAIVAGVVAYFIQRKRRG